MATPVSNSVSPSGDVFIDGLIQGSSWSFSGSRVLTYKLHEVPGDDIDGIWNKPLAVQQAMNAWGNVANISFQNLGLGGSFLTSPADLAVTATGDNLFIIFDPLFVTGLAIFPDPNFADLFRSSDWPRPEGDIFIDNVVDVFFPGSFNRGGLTFETLLHEIGHALGLKHPHDDGANSRPTFTDLGINELDLNKFTVMSFNDWTGNDFSLRGNIATPMPLDILAIQYIYGANMNFRTGDNVYVLKDNGIVRTIWDAGGNDTLDASNLAAGIEISLEEFSYIQTGNLSLTAIAFNVTIENAIGTRFSDVISGNDADNLLIAGRGKDELIGGDGDDTLKGGKGKDELFGGDDNDVLKGGKGADVLNGGAGDDTLKGGPGRDKLDGGEGSDTYIVSANENKVDNYKDNGSSGVDTLDTSKVTSLMLTPNFSNEKKGLEEINGATDGTVLTGDGSTGLNWDFTDIELNNITLKGTLLADRITGSAGNDVIKGSKGKDTVSGGDGDDTLKGGRGADSISGGDGDDFLKGGRGQDTLVGGSGNDTLTGGLGADVLTGGSGADIFIIDADDTVLDFNPDEGDQIIDISLNNNALIIDSQPTDFDQNASGLKTITDAGGAVIINGGDGDDFLKGGRGQDTLVGGSGDDTLTGGLGADDFRFDSISEVGDLITDFDHAEGDELQLNGGNGASEFQWGYQSTGDTKANTFGAITSDFLLEGSNKGALLTAVSNAASSLFGSTIAGGVSSVGYFFGLTAENNGLFYIIANQHTETAAVTTTFSTVTVAILQSITGFGTGTNEIAGSDIILF